MLEIFGMLNQHVSHYQIHMKVDLGQRMKEKKQMFHPRHKKNRTVVNLYPLFYDLVDSYNYSVEYPYQFVLFHTIYFITSYEETKIYIYTNKI